LKLGKIKFKYIERLKKGIVSELTIKFWMSQKCGKIKDLKKKKKTTSVVE
jgi:hypothetical protein